MSDGSKYEGDFRFGLITGFGKYTDTSNSKYIGQFSEN